MAPLLDEPTQGVDIAAQADLHQRPLDAASAGTADLVARSATSPEEIFAATRLLLDLGVPASTRRGANPEAARFSGVDVTRMTWGALISSGVLAAVAGGVLSLQPGTVPFSGGVPYLCRG